MIGYLFFGLAFVFRATRTESVRFERRQTNWTIGQTVQTNSGAVIGHPAPSATDVSEYLGIPFAQPPLGPLRFAAPLPYTNNGLINASSFGPACLIVEHTTSSTASNVPAVNVNFTIAGAATSQENGEVGIQTQEDCLTLNIWTKPQVGESGKAVMLWVYGGAFTTGNSNNPLYNGQYIADQEDVVVVTFNYRVNIFGFPGTPAGIQNVGLLDQRLAIEWVRDNIAGFGGDHTRITLFGQSAGAQSIDYYAYTYLNDPIASAFIQESGTTSLIPALNSSASAAMWYNVTSKIGCGSSTTDPAEILSCMRAANSTDILNALGSQSFVPTIDNTLVFGDYANRSQSGEYIHNPLLIGSNDNESSIFRIEYLQEGLTPPPSWDEYTLQRWTCPTAVRANASVANGVPTWRYRWFGVFPNTNLTTYPDSGAYHGSEIPIISNTPPTGSGILSDTSQEVQVISYMQSAWATFAKSPVDGLTGFGWPSYNPAASTLLRLGWEDAPGLNTSFPSLYDAPCGTLFPINATGGNTSSGGASGSSGSQSPYPNGAGVAVPFTFKKLGFIIAMVWVMGFMGLKF